MIAREWLRYRLSRLWAHLTFQHGMAAAACGFGIWMHYEYRLQGSWVFLVLPAVGLALILLEVLLIVDQFTGSLPRWDPVRRLLSKLEFSAGLLVRLFVYSALLWYANGILDGQRPYYRAAMIDAESWKRTAGLPTAYSWVTLRYLDDTSQTTQALITWRERQALWGAQPVSVTLKHGLFGLPSVTAIERDWGWYGDEILKRAPTASMVLQRKLDFDFTHDRWQAGIEAGRRYLEQRPTDWETAAIAGGLLFLGVKYNDSLPFLKQAVEQHPTYEMMQMYGTALNWAGQSPKAAEVFKSSLRLDPNNWEAYYHLGYVYGDMAKYEEAIGYFEESLKRRPGSLEINMMIAKHRQDIQWRDSRTQKKAQPISTDPR